MQAAATPESAPPLELPADTPPALREELARRHARLVAIQRGRYQHPLRTYMAFTTPAGGVHAHFSLKPDDVPLFAHDVAVRSLIGTDGVLRSPRVLAHGPGWTLAETVEPETPPIDRTVELVVEAAMRIAELELPPSPWPEHPGGRLVLLRRRYRLLRTPLPTRDVVAAREIISESPLPRATSHGSYQHQHVFLSAGAAWLIDWEDSGTRPLGFDLLTYWVNVGDDELRRHLFAATVDAVGKEHERELQRLRYALLVRMIASKFVDDDQPEGARRLLELLPAIREAAR